MVLGSLAPVAAQPHTSGGDALLRLNALHERFVHDTLKQEALALLERPDALDASSRSKVHYLLSSALDALGEPVEATRHGQLAYDVARAAEDRALQIKALNQLSRLATYQKRYEDAYRYRREQYTLAKLHGDSVLLVAALNNLGNMYTQREMADSAEWAFRQGLAHVPKAGTFDEVVVLSNLGGLLSEQGRHAEALPLLRRSVERVDTTDLRSMARALNNLGYGLVEAGWFAEADAVLQRSEAYNQRSDHGLGLTSDNLQLRAQALEGMGDLRAALALLREDQEVRDRLFRSTLDDKLVEQEKRFETKLKEEEIERLDAVTNEQAALLRAQNMMLYGSLAMLVLALVAAALLWRNFSQERRHAAVLEGLNTELKDQKERIEEINRLLQLKVLRTQMNPHFIYNCLNAIANLVRKGDTVGAASYLDGFARLLRMVLDHSVKDRVPIGQELDFLRQYLKLEALRFPDGLHYEVDADRDLLDEDVPVPALLVQPFVENAIWHGLATKEGEKRLSVRFEEHEGSMRCVVEDNGVGRQAAPKRAHSDGSPSMGLQLTNERLQLLAFKLNGHSDRLRFHDLVHPDGSAAGTRVELVLE